MFSVKILLAVIPEGFDIEDLTSNKISKGRLLLALALGLGILDSGPTLNLWWQVELNACYESSTKLEVANCRLSNHCTPQH